MLVTLRSGKEFFLDGLVLETILGQLCGGDLARVSSTCQLLNHVSEAVAQRALSRLAKRLQCTRLRLFDGGSRISQLIAWEQLAEATVLWLQADRSRVRVAERGGETRVTCSLDLSGRGNDAASPRDGPALKPNAVNGRAAFEFDGSSVLKTKPFEAPIAQPVTLMVVARARGDTTIIDALGTNSSRFELCHGYPSGYHATPEICMTASGHDAVPTQSMRGTTRGTGEWHVITAIFDTRKSELFVDGAREAAGKNVGNNRLDGLSIGCDHSGVFFLMGSVAEVRLFSCHLSRAHRIQLECSLARKYNLNYKVDVPLTAQAEGTRSPSGRSRFPPLRMLRSSLSRTSSRIAA